MRNDLVYWGYGVAALGALAIYFAMPRESRSRQRTALLVVSIAAVGLLAMFLHRLAGEAASGVIFMVLTLAALACAARVITHPRPVYSALYFIMVVLSTAALIIICGAEFLGVALVVVYAGAILVTYVFVIMLAQPSAPREGGQFAMPSDYDRSAREPLIAAIAGFILVGTIAALIVNVNWHDGGQVKIEAPEEGNTLALGRLLLSPEFAVSVEVAGVLLMVAMIGAIAIARKKLPSLETASLDVLPPGEIGKHAKPF